MKNSPQKRKHQSQTDVQAARGRLKGVLNDSIASGNQEVDDISEDYEEEPEEDEEQQSTSEAQPPKQRGRPRKIPIAQPKLKRYSPQMGLLTPNKRRKRERELASTPGHKIQAESFVMKLFDRILDLSKYTEQTALYPLCRAWMANNPSLRSHREMRPPSPAQRKDDGGELLAQLRKGTIKEVSLLSKPKRADLPRLPPQQEPKKFSGTDELTEETNSLKGAEREQLMAQHLSKWKRIKSDWQKHTKRFQQRNEVNFQILQQLFRP